MPVQNYNLDNYEQPASKYDTSNTGATDPMFPADYSLPVDVPRVTPETSPVDLGNMTASEYNQRHGSDRGERNRQDVKV